jgi:hypothetical protein
MAMSFWAAAGFAGQSRLKAEEGTRCRQRVKKAALPDICL